MIVNLDPQTIGREDRSWLAGPGPEWANGLGNIYLHTSMWYYHNLKEKQLCLDQNLIPEYPGFRLRVLLLLNPDVI